MFKVCALAVLVFSSPSLKAVECQGTPEDIQACGEAKAAEEKLNLAYRALLKKLNHPSPEMVEHHSAAKISLVRAQRAWVQFREDDCAAAFDLADGTSKSPLATSCYAEHAIARAQQLKAMANGR